MSRLSRYVGLAAAVLAVPAFAQDVTVVLPVPHVQVLVPAPEPVIIVPPRRVLVVPAPVIVDERTVVQPGPGNRGKHKGQHK